MGRRQKVEIMSKCLLDRSDTATISEHHCAKLAAPVQGGGTGGLAFFDTIYKAATLPASWASPEKDLHPGAAASPRPLPNQGGLMATVSDLHHEQHTARPELYAPKVKHSCFMSDFCCWCRGYLSTLHFFLYFSHLLVKPLTMLRKKIVDKTQRVTLGCPIFVGSLAFRQLGTCADL